MVEEVIRVVGGRRSLRMRRGLRSLRRISRRKRCWEDRVLWDMSMGGMRLRTISNRRSSIRDSSSSNNNNSNNNNNTGSGGGDKNPPPSENARGKQPAARASLADAPRPPALWPWEWMPALGAIVHPQGCAICDAYLDHLAIERALGIRSLRRAEEARTREFKYDNTKYDEGFRDGLRVGRDDAAIAAAPYLLAEVARL